MIRRAAPADLDRVLRIERAAFTAPHWPWEAYEHLLLSSPGVGRVLLVAEREGVVNGFAGGSLVAGEAQLESIAVDESARRGGSGRALCEAFLAWARYHGAALVSLEVRASSEHVQHLYRSLGFHAVGVRPGYYANPAEDGIVMVCALPERSVGEEKPKTESSYDV